MHLRIVFFVHVDAMFITKYKEIILKKKKQMAGIRKKI